MLEFHSVPPLLVPSPDGDVFPAPSDADLPVLPRWTGRSDARPPGEDTTHPLHLLQDSPEVGGHTVANTETADTATHRQPAGALWILRRPACSQPELVVELEVRW